jgi:acyl-coenzyme A synthetase/AMP-(fatty) acid ligase
LIVIEKIHQHALNTPGVTAVAFNGISVDYPTFYRSILAVRRTLATHNLRQGSVGVVWTTSLLDAWLVNLALRSLGLITIAVQSVDEAAQFDRLNVGCVVVSEDVGSERIAALGLPKSTPVITLKPQLVTEGPIEPPPADRLDGGHILLTSATTGRYKKVWANPAGLETGVGAGIQRIKDQVGDLVGPDQRAVNMGSFGLWTGMGYGVPIGMWFLGSTVVIWQAPEPWRSFDWPGITNAIVTPAFLQAILEAPEGALKPQPSVNIGVVGGAMSTMLARKARERLSPRIVNMLGSTEGGFWAMTPILKDEDLRLHRVSPTQTLEVVDEDGKAVPAGQLGELRVKVREGAGYYDDPEATARFFRDGWFYPGDLAIRHPDGRLSLHGRVTDVLSIQGDKRPAEPFERALQEKLEVEDVCLFSMTAPEGEVLHAVLQTRTPPAPEAVTAALNDVLYGFPKAVVHVVEAMPRNHMGKVQRLKLKQQLMAQGR